MKNYSSVLIIYNPNALKGKIDDYIPEIKKRLSLRYSVVDAMSSPEIDGAESLALKYASKYDVLVSCGGDGTVHNVINGVMKSRADCVVGILPFGTCNDVARSLKIPCDFDKAIDCLLRLNITKYSLMSADDEFISYSLATGYLTNSTYATTNKQKKRLGRFAYFISAIKYLFKFKSLPITITADGERIHGKFIYFMLLNGEYAGGFRLNKNKEYNNGKTQLVLIKKTKALGGFFTFIKMFMFGIKSIRKSKCAIVKEVGKVKIENHANAPFTLDGEKTKFLKKEIVCKHTINIVKN